MRFLFSLLIFIWLSGCSVFPGNERNGEYQERASEKVTLLERDSSPEDSYVECSSACECPSLFNEVCNNIDDNCDGQIDEGLQRACSIESPRSSCSPGKQTCEAGRWSVCLGARLSLSPSCNFEEDLDCDGKIDQAKFGRITRVYENKLSESSTRFAVLSQESYEDKTILLISRAVEQSVVVELWKFNRKGEIDVFLVDKTSLIHGAIALGTYLKGRIYIVNKDKILVGYCSHSDQNVKPIISTLYCKVFYTDWTRKVSKLISLPKPPSGFQYTNISFQQTQQSEIIITLAQVDYNETSTAPNRRKFFLRLVTINSESASIIKKLDIPTTFSMDFGGSYDLPSLQTVKSEINRIGILFPRNNYIKETASWKSILTIIIETQDGK